MKRYTAIILFVTLSAWAADNEVYVDQAGNTANIDIEQLGESNIIGGLNSVAGTLTAFDLDGTGLTLDINQIGNTNKFLGDITGDSITGLFEFDGDTNSFTIQGDPTNTFGIDSSNYNVDVTGSTNTFTLNHGTAALASQLDLDWIIQGDGNTISYALDIDGATSYLDIDGDSNNLTYDGDGADGGYFYLDQTGNSRTFNIQQQSTINNDWLKIITSSTGGTLCVIQNDGGTSTSC
jgi:hypothetical protein|tara:strand:- start:68 stop:775 length:708 start_codon:yes stop_codon:yes gene_type:complete